jgi:hypothetical protein
MRNSRVWLVAATALITTPFMGLSAQAASCVTGTVASYVALGAGGCSVDGLTFSNINVSASGVTLGNIIPYLSAPEFGLTVQIVGNVAGGTSASGDVLWSYNVSGNFINDAFLQAIGGTGVPPGNGSFAATESLTSGNTLIASLTCSGLGSAVCTDAKTFANIATLTANKDLTIAGGSITGTFENVSALTNAFSTVPIPGALPLFATGIVGLWAVGRKRKKQKLESAIA